MSSLVWIAAGGAAGAVLRYLLHGFGDGLGASPFPLGTLLVNVIGCALIGVLGVLLVPQDASHPEFRFLLVVGLLGGFTTFSTFGWDTLQLMLDGRVGLALLYVALSNVLGLAAAWGGYAAAKALS